MQVYRNIHIYIQVGWMRLYVYATYEVGLEQLVVEDVDVVLDQEVGGQRGRVLLTGLVEVLQGPRGHIG